MNSEYWNGRDRIEWTVNSKHEDWRWNGKWGKTCSLNLFWKLLFEKFGFRCLTVDLMKKIYSLRFGNESNGQSFPFNGWNNNNMKKKTIGNCYEQRRIDLLRASFRTNQKLCDTRIISIKNGEEEDENKND